MVLIEGRSREPPSHAPPKRPLEDPGGFEAVKVPRAECLMLPLGLPPLPPGLMGGLGGLPMPGLPLLPHPGMPGMPGQGLAALHGHPPPPMSLPPGVPSTGLPQGLSMGQFDLFAHLAASARMSAAMAAASAPPEDEGRREPVEEPAAFDKEALMRLARQASQAEPAPAEPALAAAQGAVLDAPGTAPASEGLVNCGGSPAAPLQASAAAPSVRQPPDFDMRAQDAALVQDAMEPADAAFGGGPAAWAAGAEPPGGQPTQLEALPPGHLPQDASGVTMTWAASRPTPSEPRKRDTSSVASVLQQVQDNVARGRTGGSKAGERDGPVLPQAFGASPGGAGGGAAGAAAAQAGTGLLEALHQRLEAVAAGAEGRRGLEAEILAALPKLEPLRAAELISRTYSTEAMRTVQFLEDLAQVTLPSLSRLGSPHLVRVLGVVACWTLSTGGRDSEGRARFPDNVRSFFLSASAELSLRLMDIAPRDLSNIATALSSVGLAEERFFASLARAAVARSERFQPEEIVTVAMAFDRAGLVHTELLLAVARCIHSHVSQVPVRDLLKGMQALAACCVRDSDLSKAVGDHLQHAGAKGTTFSPEELCAVVWAFCSLGFYHDQLFQAVFRTLGGAAGAASEAQCQFYEIHITLKAFRPESYVRYELAEDAVQALRSHYKKHRGGKGREVKLERTSEKIHKDMSETLRSVVDGLVSRQQQTDLGPAVDLAVTRRRGASGLLLGIEVDGPHSLLRSLDPSAPQLGQPMRVRGAVLLKRHLLQKHGLRLAVVSEDLWRGLADSREKRDFLRELLRNAGVPKDRLL